MEFLRDRVLQEDLEILVRGTASMEPFPFGSLAGKTVLVTGATGLIGSQIVLALACANQLQSTDIHILALCRSREKAARVFGEMGESRDSRLTVLTGDVMDLPEYDGEIDYIIHGASPTSSRFFVEQPVQTIETALTGTQHVLELAAEKRVKGFVYLSSLEVYGVPQKVKEDVSEKDYGYIDPLQVRSSYSEGKRMTECLCAAFHGQYGVPVKIARLSQTFGPGVVYDDGRVFAEFARCALEHKDIVLHTQGGTVRTYLYTRDAVAGILQILTAGVPGEAYNVTNEATRISIRDMAQLVCGLIPAAGIQVLFDCPEDISSFGYNPEMVIALNTGKLCALTGEGGYRWKAQVNMEEMYLRMMQSMSTTRQ